MRENTCNYGYVTQFETPLWPRLTTMGGGEFPMHDRVTATLAASFPKWECRWTCLGYFLMNGTTLHFQVEVRCMHHYERDWFELWKSWWLVVECMLNWWIFVYDYGYCYCFPSNYCHLMFVDFFYNKLTLTIFVPCGWYLWWSQTFIHGSRWTTLDDVEGDSFARAAKLMCVRHVASDILKRGGWIKILQIVSPIKNSTLILMQVPSSLKDEFLNDDSN